MTNYKDELYSYMLILKDETKTMNTDQLFKLIEHIAWCYYKLDNYKLSLDYYEKALELIKDDYECINMIIINKYNLLMFNDALFDLNKLFRHKKRKLKNLYIMEGNCLSAQCKFKEANKAYKTAIEISKDKRLYHNIAKNHLTDGNYDKSEYFLMKSLKAEVVDENQTKQKGRFMLADLQLRKGEYEKGWINYQHRDEKLIDTSKHIISHWTGQDLTNKRLVIIHEQGFGDTLQFVRFVNNIVRCNTHITIVVQNGLEKLINYSFNDVNVLTEIPDLLSFDYQIYMLNLPLALRCFNDESLKSQTYLKVNEKDKNHWLDKIPGKKFKVGILFKGENRRMVDLKLVDDRRSMKLSDYKDILELPNIDFYNVTYSKLKPEIQLELQEFPQVIDLSQDINNFYDTACLISNLDLVIGVDTSTIHLTGALGIPSILLSRKDGCWRWGTDSDRTPYYENMQILRQTEFNNWTNCIKVLYGILRLK